MYYYILNPTSGGGRINKIQDRLKERLKELGIAGEFVKSLGEGDITKLTVMGIKRGYKTIVAVGGNGTINEVINGIGNSEVAVGIIPIGHKNELAKSLGIPDWQTACNILAARKIEELDIGRVGKSYFITSVNVGFEADIAAQKSDENSILGRPKYYRKALSWASKFKPQKATINFDDNYIANTEFFNIQVSNSKFSGGKINLKAPKSNMLDVMITGKMPYFSSLKYVIDPNSIEQGKRPDTSFFRAKRITITTQKPLAVSVDGKVLYKTPVVCKISSRKLKLIVARKKGPKKSPVKKQL